MWDEQDLGKVSAWAETHRFFPDSVAAAALEGS